MIFDRLCGSDRFSTHEKWSIILKSSETHLFPHSFAKSHVEFIILCIFRHGHGSQLR
jgi:hypothetical protein